MHKMVYLSIYLTFFICIFLLSLFVILIILELKIFVSYHSFFPYSWILISLNMFFIVASVLMTRALSLVFGCVCASNPTYDGNLASCLIEYFSGFLSPFIFSHYYHHWSIIYTLIPGLQYRILVSFIVRVATCYSISQSCSLGF